MGGRFEEGPTDMALWITHDQWDRIKDFLPGREGHVGGTAEDNRLFVGPFSTDLELGVPGMFTPAVWRLENGPSTFQPVGEEWGFRIFKLLASDHDNECMMIDATIVRADEHSAGARKKRRASHGNRAED